MLRDSQAILATKLSESEMALALAIKEIERLEAKVGRADGKRFSFA